MQGYPVQAPEGDSSPPPPRGQGVLFSPGVIPSLLPQPHCPPLKPRLVSLSPSQDSWMAGLGYRRRVPLDGCSCDGNPSGASAAGQLTL